MKRPVICLALAVLSMFSADVRGDCVAVVVDPTLRDALREWESFRRGEGHRFVWLNPVEFQRAINSEHPPFELANTEQLVVLLVGDGASTGAPTAFVPSEVLRRYGPERSIATDYPHGLIAGVEGIVARVPLNEPALLRAYFDRVMRRERRAATRGDLRLQLAAGVGGFSPLIDGVIERVASNVVTRLAPAEATLSLKRYPRPTERASRKAVGAAERGGVWVWMGHGRRDQLHGVRATEAVAACGGADIAVLLACYAGDFSEANDCVAEQLIKSEEGPLAVIGATRVTMPYGNARLGTALLTELAASERSSIGDLYTQSTRRLLANRSGEEARGLDDLAKLLGEDRSLLEAERIEHRAAYHLLGDPLLSLKRPERVEVHVERDLAREQPMTLRFVSPLSGTARVAFYRPGSIERSPIVAEGSVEAGVPYDLAIAAAPSWRSGKRFFRVTVEGKDGLGAGGVVVERSIRSPAEIAKNTEGFVR